MTSLFGIPVIESSLIPEFQPTLQVRPDVPMTDEGRAKMNAWLLEMFGERRIIYVIGNNHNVFANPNTVAMLRVAPLVEGS